jgi:hypothetical protein
MQTLTCALGGHEWVREGRGRPPKNCPEHQTPAQLQYAERHRVFYVPRPQKPKADAAPLDPARGDMQALGPEDASAGLRGPLPTHSRGSDD